MLCMVIQGLRLHSFVHCGYTLPQGLRVLRYIAESSQQFKNESELSTGECKSNFHGTGLEMTLIISNHIPLPNLSSWLHRAIGKLGNVVYHCVQKKGKWFGEKLVNICHKKTNWKPSQLP